jgi:hypothetical protein
MKAHKADSKASKNGYLGFHHSPRFGDGIIRNLKNALMITQGENG